MNRELRLTRTVFAKLAATGWKLNLQSAPRPGQKGGVNSKTKFTCPSCGQNVWGKPDTEVLCMPCLLEKHADSKIDCRSAMMLSADASPAVGKSYEIAKPPVEQLTKRKRGRPPGSKNKKLESVEPPKPRRGRPPGSKNKPKEVAAIVASPSYEQQSILKRKRGRPKGSKNKPKQLAA